MTSATPRYRTERDSMGEMNVPADAYYGASTARAVENFPISNLRFPRRFIAALGLVKHAAADVSHNLGLLESPERARVALTWLGERSAPGGLLIGDGLDTTMADESSWGDYNARNLEQGRRAGQSRMRIGYAGDLGDWFEYWLVSPADLEEAVRDTPWRVERVELDEDERFRGEYVATLRRD